MAQDMKILFHEFNHTFIVNRTFSTEQCKMRPRAPDWLAYFLNIYAYLILMFCMQVSDARWFEFARTQVLGSYALARIRLLVVLDMTYRRQSKARTLHLYHKLTQHRLDYDRLARARLRYAHKRHLLQAITELVFWGILA